MRKNYNVIRKEVESDFSVALECLKCPTDDLLKPPYKTGWYRTVKAAERSFYEHFTKRHIIPATPIKDGLL